MKKIKYLIIILLVAFFSTGCVKYNATMKINKNKSMEFKVIYALDTTYFGKKSVYDKKEKKRIEKQGFKLTKYEKDKMQGYTLTRNIKNIDKLSSTKDTKYDLTDLSGPKDDKVTENTPIFKIKKGFFKNHYYAKMKFVLGNTSSGGVDMSKYVDIMDLTYKVELPYKVIKTNAQTVSKDKKSISWNLGSFKKDYMTYEFELYNTKTIILVATAGLLIIGGIILLIVVFIKRKKSNNKPEKVEDKSKAKAEAEQKKEEKVTKTAPKKTTTAKKTAPKKTTTTKKKTTTKKEK